MPWWLLHVPCPTPAGETAAELYAKRERSFDDELRAAARTAGCRFHRAWTADDGSAFYAIAYWESAEDAGAFYEQAGIEGDAGERFVRLNGGIGLVPLPDDVGETSHPLP